MLVGRPLVTFVAYRPQAPSGRGELASCCLHALAAAGHLPSDAAVRRWPGCRDAATVSAFAEDLAAHGGDPGKIARTGSGMSAAFIAGVRGHLPNAPMTSDRFHVNKSCPKRSATWPEGSWLPA
jgi:Transposase